MPCQHPKRGSDFFAERGRAVADNLRHRTKSCDQQETETLIRDFFCVSQVRVFISKNEKGVSDKKKVMESSQGIDTD